VTFCNALSELAGLKPAYEFVDFDIWGTAVKEVAGASGYRLPTEAEWEYAARAGQTHTYAGSNRVDEVAWYASNSGNQTHPVGQKDANVWGLHDMSGNVWEWTGDWYASDTYTSSPAEDPQGALTGGHRVRRGGSFRGGRGWARAADRGVNYPDYASDYLGFRVVLPD
jgi:formylglycine-generating enzyme required for sulfatase activity